jgi:hypothetical protein
MEKIVRSETSIEYFKELVERAMERQRVMSSELSCFYLVQLLENFVSFDQKCAEAGVDRGAPLGTMLCEALRSSGGRRFALLKFTGDLALFISGFFSDSIVRRRVDLDYYVRLGGYAYGGASRFCPLDTVAVFQELARKFPTFVDVLNEVSEETTLVENAGILRQYEKWLQTGSRRSEELLRREGILVGSTPRNLH